VLMEANGLHGRNFVCSVRLQADLAQSG
jgi:hypothetical protein